MLDGIEFFKKLRDVSDAVVQAMDSGDEEKIETALGRFMLLMVQMDALKG